MTRKRFVKLLMAKGCSRNHANVLAYVVCWYSREPYARGYEQVKYWDLEE